MTRRKIDWTLTQGTFDRFLQALDPDRTAAGEQYEHLRAAVVKFFDWRGARTPEECADEVIDRVSRKLHDGETIVDLRSYCYGVARMLLLERAKDDALVPIESEVLAAPAPQKDAADERQLQCLDRCIKSLSATERDLILEYHRERGQAKIRSRKSLADTLGIAAGALRIRAHRIRAKLEACVTACVSNGAAAKHSSASAHMNRGG